MSEIGKKIGYLRGLWDARKAEECAPDGAVFNGIMEVLEALSERSDELQDLYSELNEYVTSIDDDLSDLEDEVDSQFDGDEDDDELPFGEDAPARLRALPSSRPSGILPRLCGECGGVFFVQSGNAAGSRYTCPLCGKETSGETPTAEKVTVVPPLNR